METCYVLILTETEVKIIRDWTKRRLEPFQNAKFGEAAFSFKPDRMVQILENLKAKLDDSLK